MCAAGSLLGVALNVEPFPVGKIEFLDLHPLDFEEFLEGTKEEELCGLLQNRNLHEPYPALAHDRLWEQWKRYLVTGGFAVCRACLCE